jgi:DNA-binding transcriptional ArsR family regulator
VALVNSDSPSAVLGDTRAETVARRLGGLAEPTRLKIVTELRARESATVQELADAVGASLANASKHLQVLHQCGIVTREKQGNFVRYSLAAEAMGALAVYAVRILGGVRRNAA